MYANRWTKSTRSNGNGGNNCVEAFWKKSTRSNPSGNCVQVKGNDDEVMVRDTKLGDASPVLSFPDADWRIFLDEIKRGVILPKGAFITTERSPILFIDVRDHRLNGGSPILSFTESEWRAFVLGVKDGEFDLSPR